MIERQFALILGDGETIRGDIRIPDGPPPLSAIVVIHGFKGFKDWGFFPHVCRCLAADGHTVVSFNFSLNGVGDDLENFTRLDAFSRNTFSRELNEVQRVVDEVLHGGLLPRPPHRIGLLGHSRGGGVAILAARDAAQRHDGTVRALATWAAVADFDRWTEETREEWREERRIHVLNSRTGQQMPLGVELLDDFEANRERLDVGAAAADLDLPWVIVHGEADPAVLVGDALRLKEANPRAKLEVIRRAGHTFEARHPFEGSTPELDHALDVTRQHFRRHLDPDGMERGGQGG